MAITKTLKLKSIKYTPAYELLPEHVWVEYEVIIDDPDDSTLPIFSTTNYGLNVNSDVSNEEAIVQSIFNAVFNKAV